MNFILLVCLETNVVALLNPLILNNDAKIFLYDRLSTPDILRQNTAAEPDPETQSAALGQDAVSVQVKKTLH